MDARFAAGDGEELLAAIGPAVAELFPELPLRVGVERGVNKEAGQRLNLTGVGAGLMAAVLTSSVQERIDDSVETPVDGADLKRDFDLAQRSARVANIGWIGGAAGCSPPACSRCSRTFGATVRWSSALVVLTMH